jgi:hypothetical protein
MKRKTSKKIMKFFAKTIKPITFATPFKTGPAKQDKDL